MSTPTPSGVASVVTGRPASELTDGELERQGTQAHATRNWVFLHGTAEQFARHTSRMLELEQEYLRRHPQRTWQGSGGAVSTGAGKAAALREALRAIAAQLEALATEPSYATRPAAEFPADPVLLVLLAVGSAQDGRLHKLEVHQAAREAGLDRSSLATLYTAAEPLLSTDRQDRVITEAGLRRLRESGWRGPTARSEPINRGERGGEASGGEPVADVSGPRTRLTLTWNQEQRPAWDADKQRVIGAAEPGALEVRHAIGDALPGDWWSASVQGGPVVGYGWMDVGWGAAEILLAVDPSRRESGIGSFVLSNLEQAAASQGLNYVYNSVPSSHPDADGVRDWLTVRGYRDTGDGLLRKHVQITDADADADGDRYLRPDPAVPTAAASVPVAGSDRGPGAEDRGGYVDVEDHQY